MRSDPRAQLELDRLDRYSPDAEAAVYFSALEAVQNAAKHAGPDARITVALRHDGDELCFEVRDDGGGFDPEQHPPRRRPDRHARPSRRGRRVARRRVRARPGHARAGHRPRGGDLTLT